MVEQLAARKSLRDAGVSVVVRLMRIMPMAQKAGGTALSCRACFFVSGDRAAPPSPLLMLQRR